MIFIIDDDDIRLFREEYFFLSNMYLVEIIFRNYAWKSSEHAYQAYKTTDMGWFEKIHNAPTPYKAKTLGNEVPYSYQNKNFQRDKVHLMEGILRVKFTIPEMRKKLIATGDKYLVEGNTWHDNFWGDCSCDKCVDKPGRNQLGVSIMEIRTNLTK